MACCLFKLVVALSVHKVTINGLFLQNISKVVSLGRRNATVPTEYSVDQKAEEDSGRLEQHIVGTMS